MDHTFCPGSTKLRQPTPEEFTCMVCGDEVEIWSDEVEAHCQTCHTLVQKNSVMSCLDWCKKARECVGEEMYNTYMNNREKVKS